MRRVVIALTVCLALSGPHVRAQTAPPSSVLLFVDSLHIPFNQTPAIRRALKQAVDRLIGSGRSVGLVTDGYDVDPYMLPPTTEPANLVKFRDRVKGDGLKPAETDNPTPGVAAEMAYREKEARSTLQEALMRFQPGAVIYISAQQVQPTGLGVPVFVTTPQEIDAAIDRLLQLAAIPGGAVTSTVPR